MAEPRTVRENANSLTSEEIAAILYCSCRSRMRL